MPRRMCIHTTEVLFIVFELFKEEYCFEFFIIQTNKDL